MVQKEMLKVRVKINKLKRELERPNEMKKRVDSGASISPFRPSYRHNPVDEMKLKHALATEIDNLKALEMKVKSIQWEQKLNQSLVASRHASPQPPEERKEIEKDEL